MPSVTGTTTTMHNQRSNEKQQTSAPMSFSEKLKLSLNDGARGGGPASRPMRAQQPFGNKGNRSRSSSMKRDDGMSGNNGRPYGGGGHMILKKNSAPPMSFSGGGFRNGNGDRGGFNRNNNNRWEDVASKRQMANSREGERLRGGEDNNQDSQEDEDEDTRSVASSVEASTILDVLEIDPSAPKHPLLHSWTLWHFMADTNLGWDANLVKVHTVRYVEDFWALYNHLKETSRLSSGQDYCLFKEGVRPAWEDNANKNGGRWVIGGLDPNFRAPLLDALWLEVMMFLIGAEAEGVDHMVNGAVVMVRNKGDKICVWCKDSRPMQDVMAVGKALKERLNIHRRIEIGFEDHRAAKNKRGVRGNNGPNYMYNV